MHTNQTSNAWQTMEDVSAARSTNVNATTRESSILKDVPIERICAEPVNALTTSDREGVIHVA
jgi:hypothetical protein